MNLEYRTSFVAPDKLRTLHIVVIDSEILTTTIAKEVLQFVKARNPTKHEWKELKEAVRLGRPLILRNNFN